MKSTRAQHAQLAQDTLRILSAGCYQTPSGRTISLAAPLRTCINHTRCYEPEALADMRAHALAQPISLAHTLFEVTNETTLHCSARLASAHADLRIGVLNFASARNPGGGFLSGAQAQEESLARSSGLYQSLLKCRSFYDHHRAPSSALYSDRMIYSPACPVFRNDAGDLLEQTYAVDFITSPAPNAGAARQNEPKSVAKIADVLRERASKILGLALYQHCEMLVLGAWGCGVFKNDPTMVARTFGELLASDGLYARRFQRVAFAVLDTSRDQQTYQAFAQRFAS